MVMNLASNESNKWYIDPKKQINQKVSMRLIFNSVLTIINFVKMIYLQMMWVEEWYFWAIKQWEFLETSMSKMIWAYSFVSISNRYKNTKLESCVINFLSSTLTPLLYYL